MRTPHRLLAAALMLAAAAGACVDSPTGPAAPPNDLASALGELSLDALIPGGAGISAPVASTALTPIGCAYNSASLAFTCPTVTSNGLTVTQDYTLLTSANTPQSSFDAATTNAVRQHIAIAGTAVSGGESIDVAVDQTFTLSGLLSDTHVLDGVQTANLSSPGFNLTEQVTTTVSSLVLPQRGSSNRYPRSGTIAMTLLDSDTAGGASSTLSFVITFNGSSTAAVDVTTDGVVQHCTVNLAGSGQLACT